MNTQKYLKVLIVLEKLDSTSNLARCIVEICEKLKEHKVIPIIASEFGNLTYKLKTIGVSFYPIEFYKKGYFSNKKQVLELIKIIQSNNINVIDVIGAVPFKAALSASTQLKIPLIYTVDFLPNKSKKILGVKYSRICKSEVIISTNNFVGEATKKYIKLKDTQHIKIQRENILNSFAESSVATINLTEFYSHMSHIEVEQRPIIFCPSWGQSDESTVQILEAFVLLKELLPSTNFLGIFCGISQKIDWQKIKIIIHNLNLSSNIRYVGKIDDIRVMYKASDIVVDALKDVSIPWKVMEAMTLGRRVIAVTNSSATTLIKHQQTGWLYDPEDPINLALCIREALLESTTKRIEKENKGKIMMKNKYDADSLAKTLVRVYRLAKRTLVI